MNLFAHPHRRYNPLTGEWVLVSPQRNRRPWQGQVENPTAERPPAYDPACYLCPGNQRAGGPRNPAYPDTFVFDNDFPALLADETPAPAWEEQGLLQVAPERGVCRVVCFSPRHDLTLAQMSPSQVRAVVEVWAEQTAALGALEFVRYVQVFENRGAAMGASNPHPHGQIWATGHVPTYPARELQSLANYRRQRDGCLLCEYLDLELGREERLVIGNDHFVALVPFWAVWPFEVLLVSRRHVGTLPELDGPERDALADLMRRLTSRYDNLFAVPFPYSMGFHQSPTGPDPHPEAHLHAHYYPPLLRSATVRKFMVGYEMLGEAQRDLTPEDAAARLRQVKEVSAP